MTSHERMLESRQSSECLLSGVCINGARKLQFFLLFFVLWLFRVLWSLFVLVVSFCVRLDRFDVYLQCSEWRQFWLNLSSNFAVEPILA